MDWNRAKNYTIIFLVLLNIVLFVFIFLSDQKYFLSQNQRSAVYKVLEDNNISLYADIPTVFKPLPQLYMQNTEYDIMELQNVFFDAIASVKMTEEFDKTIINNNNSTLTIQDDIVTFSTKKDFDRLNKSAAIEVCDEYIDRIKDVYTKMYLGQVVENEEYIYLEYFEIYKDYNIFNNYINFKVYYDGTIYAEFRYNEVYQLYGVKTEICSTDEALYIFMREIRRLTEESITIESIELGYFLGNSEEGKESYMVAVPHYKIFIKNSEKPYYINAYNNTMVYS